MVRVGGITMQYKRNEYFRYTFGEPCEATFRLIKDTGGDRPTEFSNKGKCQIIDISPNGLRIITELSIVIELLKVIEVNFIIDETPLSMIGELVWSKKNVNGFEYGVRLSEDQNNEQKIVNDLKVRSRKEMALKTKNVSRFDKK